MDRAAEVTERGRQTVWKIEKGKLDVRIRPEGDVGKLCDLYGADAETRRVLVALAEQTKVKGWFQPEADILPPNFDTYLGLEDTASQISWYDSNLIPGLMQTAGYARAIITSVGRRSEEETERRLKLRLRRQQALQRDRAINLNVVLHESVLRCTVGGPQVMAEQLQRVNELGQLPNVRVRVLPFDAGAHAGMTSGPFEILQFFDETMPPMVYIDGFLGGLWFKGKEELAKYEDAFHDVEDRALDQADSEELITHAVKELSRV